MSVHAGIEFQHSADRLCEIGFDRVVPLGCDQAATELCEFFVESGEHALPPLVVWYECHRTAVSVGQRAFRYLTSFIFRGEPELVEQRRSTAVVGQIVQRQCRDRSRTHCNGFDRRFVQRTDDDVGAFGNGQFVRRCRSATVDVIEPDVRSAATVVVFVVGGQEAFAYCARGDIEASRHGQQQCDLFRVFEHFSVCRQQLFDDKLVGRMPGVGFLPGLDVLSEIKRA